jgi:hypothetical protein
MKNIIEKHIVGDFYYINNFIGIIINEFTDEIILPNKKIYRR